MCDIGLQEVQKIVAAAFGHDNGLRLLLDDHACLTAGGACCGVLKALTQHGMGGKRMSAARRRVVAPDYGVGIGAGEELHELVSVAARVAGRWRWGCRCAAGIQ